MRKEEKKMVLLIDNFDSFTYNLFQYLAELGQDVAVRRNDAVCIEEIERMNPGHIVISPGPGRPEDAGISMAVIERFAGQIPILGVCLGHQCIARVYGLDVVRAGELYHGRPSSIRHQGDGLFRDMPEPFTAVRYHSLVAERPGEDSELKVTATSEEDDEIMGLAHKTHALFGVQFHPESYGTDGGMRLLENFLSISGCDQVLKRAIGKTAGGRALAVDEAMAVMERMISGTASEVEIAGLLMALHLKGEDVPELTGFARMMRRKAEMVTGELSGDIVDTCGTGGDVKGSFNISTAAAFVAAGAGAQVAKHGNRSVTSRCGSADVLEGLGVNIAIGPADVLKVLQKVGMAFFYAPRFHPSVRFVGGVRRQLGVRTVFNLLGPLCNPLAASCQLIGVYSVQLIDKMAETLVALGIKRGMVVHGEDGLDEITLTGPTHVAEIRDGWIRHYKLDPRDYGFSYCKPESLQGGDLKDNCGIILDLLDGSRGPKRDITLLNAAAAISVHRGDISFGESLDLARQSLDSGAARGKLDQLIGMSHA